MVRNFIEQRLKEVDLSLTQASLRIGRNSSYLHQFIKRGSPAELRKRDRIALSQLLGVHEDQLLEKSGSPSRPTGPEGLAESMSSVQDKPVSSVGGSAPRILTDPYHQLPVMPRDLPVYGSIEAEDGALIVPEKPVDFTTRPPSLTHVDGAYGLIIKGDVMSPACNAGSTALINPHLPGRDGDLVCLRRVRDGVQEAMVRQLVSSTENVWTVCQHKPLKQYELQRAVWTECHRVIGNLYN